MLPPKSWKFLLVEFGILGFRVQNIAQGIWNLAGIQGPLTLMNPESSTWNPESMAWNPESKTVLNSLKWGVTTDLNTQ